MVPVNVGCIVQKVLSYYDNGSSFGSRSRAQNIRHPDQFDGDRVGLFDGVELHGACGAGMVIKLAANYSVHLSMSVGKGTNNRAVLLALWGLIYFSKHRGICLHLVMGDSKFNIN